MDRVGLLEKRFATARKNLNTNDRIRTLLRELPATYVTTGDLIRELGKENHQVVAMIVENGAELKNTGSPAAPKQAVVKAFVVGTTQH